tara:strand:+ start:34398 stop:35435 length:1038 start_codon:yes stop_codon:yes gene_type:complete
MKPVLVWDFDGVLVDSLPQRVLVAYFTYQAYKRGLDPAQIIPDEIIFDTDEMGEIERIIREKRPYLVPKESGSTNYLEQLILRLDHGVDFENVEEFLRLREEFGVHPIGEQFRPIFEEIETTLSDRFQGEWDSLSPFYHGALEVFKALEDRFEYYICSQAEYGRIQRILDREGIVLDPNNIYSRDQIGINPYPTQDLSKVDKIKMIMEQTGTQQSDVVFVDDEIEQAILVSKQLPKVTMLYPVWGYIPVDWESNIFLRRIKAVTIPGVSSEISLKGFNNSGFLYEDKSSEALYRKHPHTWGSIHPPPENLRVFSQGARMGTEIRDFSKVLTGYLNLRAHTSSVSP